MRDWVCTHLSSTINRAKRLLRAFGASQNERHAAELTLTRTGDLGQNFDGDEEPTPAIFGQFVSQVPKVDFFTTSHSEPRILEGFRLPLLSKATVVFLVHNAELNPVNNDIQLSLEHDFQVVAHRRRVPESCADKGADGLAL